MPAYPVAALLALLAVVLIVAAVWRADVEQESVIHPPKRPKPFTRTADELKALRGVQKRHAWPFGNTKGAA